MVSSGSIGRGTQIGRFVVVTELGRGGMGAVYAAHDPQLDRQVALKVMRDASGGEEDRVRMLREGQAMARVTHANVITVYEVGTEGGMVFLAQELLDGGTLREWLEKPHPQPAIIEKFLAAGRGLAAAHAVGLVHRDFKPENVLLGKDGRVRVADFGLARAASSLVDAMAMTTPRGGSAHDNANAELSKSPMSQLTRTGAVMGTPMFMAPEQHKGEQADARSDQFAFCVSLYHALYKAWPFEGKTAPALADAVIEGRLAPPPVNLNVPAPVRKILLRGLSIEPAQRYPSMEALLAELERATGRSDAGSKRGRAVWFTAGAAIIVVGGAVGAYAVMQSRKSEPPPVTTTPVPTMTPGELDELTTEKGVAWLTTAIDRGQFGDAIEKYELAARPLIDSAPPRAAILEAAGAYMHVLRGDSKQPDSKHSDLKNADAKIALATQHAGTDPIATAYVDLAEAALALARGQLPAARDRSKRCSEQLATTAPVLASICHQLHGDAQSALGDSAAARTAYDAGLALGKQHPERSSSLQLALAQLDLDEGQTERAASIARNVQAECSDRNAIGCDVHARILLARVKLTEAAAQDALELLAGVKPSTIESFPVRVAHAIALGEVHGYMNEAGEDGITGLDRIETARSNAERQGFVLLMLEAKLTRLRVLLANDHEDSKSEHADLVKQARASNIGRIVRLADAALADLAGPPRAMLPADGGVPAVRTGSSGAP